MATTKNKTLYVPLVITGYILFALLIISVMASVVIPWGRLLLSPQVVIHNTILALVALTVGALLPVLLGYAIGDKSVRSKSKLSHHFNGMLFGLLAYWVMTILSIIMFYPLNNFEISSNTRMVLANLLPSAGVAIVSAALAIAHASGRQAKHDVVDYKPYAITLLASMSLLLGGTLVISIHSHTVDWLSFLPLLITIAIGALSYATLRRCKLGIFKGVTWSAVSVSVAFVSIYAVSMLTYGISLLVNTTPSAEYQALVDGIGWILALIGWGAYWRMQVKTLQKS